MNNREYVWVKPKKHRKRNSPDSAATTWLFLNTGGSGGRLFMSGTSLGFFFKADFFRDNIERTGLHFSILPSDI
jgi:hypothetical protein